MGLLNWCPSLRSALFVQPPKHLCPSIWPNKWIRGDFCDGVYNLMLFPFQSAWLCNPSKHYVPTRSQRICSGLCDGVLCKERPLLEPTQPSGQRACWLRLILHHCCCGSPPCKSGCHSNGSSALKCVILWGGVWITEPWRCFPVQRELLRWGAVRVQGLLALWQNTTLLEGNSFTWLLERSLIPITATRREHSISKW